MGVNQRYDGARQASQYGAIDNSTVYELRRTITTHWSHELWRSTSGKRIPAAAISTNAAEKLVIFKNCS